MTEMVVAVFDIASAAEAAVRDLEAARIPSAVVKSYMNNDLATHDHPARKQERAGGFWSWLLGEEPTYTQDYEAYDRSIASGHTVVTVTIDEPHADAAMGILHQHDPLDIHERMNQSASGRTSETYEAGAMDRGAPGASGTTSASGSRAGEEVIPLAEEELQVGKRTVDRGTARVRRYVVRKLVEEPVTLRDEQVTIERRRPVAGSAQGAPEGAFEERTVEVHQTAEEPVVKKAVRVGEEVVVRKDISKRTETVRDEVRRDQVEVQEPTQRKE
jgi:stress response protein YsnF